MAPNPITAMLGRVQPPNPVNALQAFRRPNPLNAIESEVHPNPGAVNAVESAFPHNPLSALAAAAAGHPPVNPGFGGPISGTPDPLYANDPGYQPALAQREMGDTRQAVVDWEARHPYAMQHGHIPGWITRYEEGLLSHGTPAGPLGGVPHGFGPGGAVTGLPSVSNPNLSDLLRAAVGAHPPKGGQMGGNSLGVARRLYPQLQRSMQSAPSPGYS